MFHALHFIQYFTTAVAMGVRVRRVRRRMMFTTWLRLDDDISSVSSGAECSAGLTVQSSTWSWKEKKKKHRMVALWHHNNDEIFNFTKWWRGRTPQHTLPLVWQQVWTTVGSVVVGTWCRLAAVAQLNVVSAWRVSGWNPAWIRGLFDEIQEAAARLLLFTPFPPLSQPTSHQHQHHHHHPHDQDSYSPHSLPGWKTVFFVDGGHPQSQLHNSNVFLVIHHGTVHFY